MSFADVMNKMDLADLWRRIENAGVRDVERALDREHPTPDDLPALFSPAAADYLEPIAQRSAAVTERRFGRVIQLYTPQYLSNECVNRCTYCGFAHDLDVPRVTLTPSQVLDEADILHREGFRHILLVSGEDRRYVNIPYLLEIVEGLHRRFDSIAIEIQPLSGEEYRQLNVAGVDGLALYQETYDPKRYGQYHPAGPKRKYSRRLEAIEHGGEAGMRSLGIGALLGLSPWRLEALLLALHGRYLTRRFWRSRISVSFPRIRTTAADYQPEFPVSDSELVQMICAMRLVLPDAELVLSTREPARLRDRLIGLGVTRMSAGSRTHPGGYTKPEDHEGEQFTVVDNRSPAEVAHAIADKGFEPVWKDFDRGLIASRVG